MERSQAKTLAYHRLSRREYSAAEVRRYLQSKGVSQEDAASVVEDLVASHYIDDARYAKILVRYYKDRGKGPRYIAQKLKQRGLRYESQDDSDASGPSDLERAKEIVARKYPRAFDDKAVAMKAYQALLRRGFSFDVARAAVRARG